MKATICALMLVLFTTSAALGAKRSPVNVYWYERAPQTADWEFLRLTVSGKRADVAIFYGDKHRVDFPGEVKGSELFFWPAKGDSTGRLRVQFYGRFYQHLARTNGDPVWTGATGPWLMTIMEINGAPADKSTTEYLRCRPPVLPQLKTKRRG